MSICNCVLIPLTYGQCTIHMLTLVLLLYFTDSASLKVFHLAHNPIGDDGMSLLSSELVDNTALIELSVWECGLSEKGIT